MPCPLRPVELLQIIHYRLCKSPLLSPMSSMEDRDNLPLNMAMDKNLNNKNLLLHHGSDNNIGCFTCCVE
jgi:hypothetical protein